MLPQLLKPLEPYHQEVGNAVMYEDKGQGEAVLSGLTVTCTMLSWWGKNAVPTEQQIPNRLQRHKISAHMRGEGSYKQLVPNSAQTDKPSFQGPDRQGRSLVPLRKVTSVC